MVKFKINSYSLTKDILLFKNSSIKETHKKIEKGFFNEAHKTQNMGVLLNEENIKNHTNIYWSLRKFIEKVFLGGKDEY